MATSPPYSTVRSTLHRFMELRGVRVHNLKNLDLDIPLRQLVVLSGVSGSGKSSLAFETLFREGQRQYLESFSASTRRQLEQIERPDVDRIAHVPVAVAIRSDRSRRNRPDARSTVASVGELLDGLRMLFSRLGRIECPDCGCDVRAHSAADVVKAIAGLPVGTRCQIGFVAEQIAEQDFVATWLARGFARAIWNGTTHDLSTKPNWTKGTETWIVVDRVVADKASADRIAESAEAALREGDGRCRVFIAIEDSSVADTCVIDGRLWRVIPFSRRLECPRCLRQFLPLEPRLFSPFLAGACPACRGSGQQNGKADCDSCHGSRLRDEARAVRVVDRSFPELCELTLPAAIDFIERLELLLSAEQLKLTDLIRADLLRRFRVAVGAGLGYLTLNRSADSLSGGELRRLMLSAVIGSQITGTLVVIDEPGAGLRDDETPPLINTLRRLVTLRNSVIVVDHSPPIIAAADYVIELGPAAGPSGGNVIFQGRPESFALRVQTSRPLDSKRAAEHCSDALHRVSLKNVTHHNLQDFQVDFPLNCLCVVTGRSGSGKTSLVTQVLFPAVCRQIELPCDMSPQGECEISGGTELADVVLIDQSPLTTSSRSNPATWLDVFDEIRQTFAATVDARQRGFTAQSFSFNSSSGGRCRSCFGTGLLKHDMQFLPDITLVCPECHGTRYRQEILDVKYRGRSIADVLAMSVSEAAAFFRSQQRIQTRFRMLEEIGLDYLVLGQPSETLSGGEAQRLKLAARLVTPGQGGCLMICDEPTAGLHPKDVDRLVACFRELIANGHSLVLADNSPELLAAADCVIELGREN
jgi:excinuclease ABC subunit A